jgi:hypothetical protein
MSAIEDMMELLLQCPPLPKKVLWIATLISAYCNSTESIIVVINVMIFPKALIY